MWECRHCGEMVRGNRNRPPSRCARCREPLFERAGGPMLVEGGVADKGLCAMHAGNESIGACARCGKAFCPVCRTRWHDSILCLTCVERYLSGAEINPEERRHHTRQAVIGCVAGITCWVMLLLAAVAALPATRSSNTQGLIVLAVFLLLCGFASAVVGVGQTLTALRVRGQRMLAAATGLALSGAFLGVCLGAILLKIGRH